MANYSGYMSVKVEADAAAMDIPTMFEASVDQYSSYIEDDLLFQDHHGVIRSAIGEFPIATTKAQVDTLIEILKRLSLKMER